MTRPDGFATADHDVGFLEDDRILDVVEIAGPVAVVAYLAVRDLSWARGERVAYASAVRRLSNAYGIAELVQLQGELEAVGLLDGTGRIPASTWSSWFGAAAARRELRRELGRRGGYAKAANRRSSPASETASPARGRGNGKPNTGSSSASDNPQPSPSQALPDRPSVVPTDVGTDGRTSVARSPSAPIYCTDYRAHQSEHRRAYAGGPFVCSVCGTPPGPTLGERLAANGLDVGQVDWSVPVATGVNADLSEYDEPGRRV